MDNDYHCFQKHSFDPEGFLQYVKGNMSCHLHAGILKFVEVYYGDFNGTKCPHYALMTDQATNEFDKAVTDHGICLMKVPCTASMQKYKGLHLTTSFFQEL
eukprot:2062976-Ditylum_brightwellii.AAC.1